MQSKSRRGNCYDNAHAESFWNYLKIKLIDGGRITVLSAARIQPLFLLLQRRAPTFRHRLLIAQSLRNLLSTHLVPCLTQGDLEPAGAVAAFVVPKRLGQRHFLGRRFVPHHLLLAGQAEKPLAGTVCT